MDGQRADGEGVVSRDPTTEPLPLTETRNPRTLSIDGGSTEEVLAALNTEDQLVADAVASQIPRIARALDAVVERWEQGGRLFYAGAGTSGRLGVLDAAECPPTFGTPPHCVKAIIAGGAEALVRSIEGAEDSRKAGRRDLEAAGFQGGDALVGIAASGSTPYVLGAVEHAASIGAVTIGLGCSPGSALERIATYPITPEVGPEAVTGSTRLKAGTAQKMVLNMLSTGLMIRTGCVLGNLMVNVQVRNEKLKRRARRIVAEVADCGKEEARAALTASGLQPRVAILMLKQGLERTEAEELLERCGDNLRKALEWGDN